MSAWLSAANSVAGSTRARVTAAGKRQVNSAVSQATRDMVGFWSGTAASARKPTRRRAAK